MSQKRKIGDLPNSYFFRLASVGVNVRLQYRQTRLLPVYLSCFSRIRFSVDACIEKQMALNYSIGFLSSTSSLNCHRIRSVLTLLINYINYRSSKTTTHYLTWNRQDTERSTAIEKNLSILAPRRLPQPTI